jgi:predicted GH43/DUF377 family glycosyl hydrolase
MGYEQGMGRRKAMLAKLLLLGFTLGLTCCAQAASAEASPIPPGEMQAIYDEAKTPFKYGIVIEPPAGKKVDCPTVFRHGGKWYMIYVELESKPEEGYTTQLAESNDLVHWKPVGTILQRGESGSWDSANAGGGLALFDTKWGGRNELQRYQRRYWLSYIGGNKYGYEQTPLSIGMASTDDPTRNRLWQKLSTPVLKPDDADARPLETETLYKSYIFYDQFRTLGAPFVMFYNAKPHKGTERIFIAVSHDMKKWKRFGAEPTIENLPPAGAKHGAISGDPQIVRMGDLWVMFYFGAFWKPGAFNTFAASRDLVHWTKWAGEDLVRASVPYDMTFAHKSWVLKHKGVVYHFYCAVGKDQHRAIALATSRKLK